MIDNQMITKTKRLCLFTIMIFSCFGLYAQRDIIYTEVGKIGLSKCEITNVTHGNKVHYIKGENSGVMEAVTIRWDGDFIDLYYQPGHEYSNPNTTLAPENIEYYIDLYAKSIRSRNIGMSLAFAGAGLGLFSGVVLTSNMNSGKSSSMMRILYIGGGLMTNVGIALWISEGIRANNNRKKIEKIRSKTSLSLGFTDNGVGLKLTFN